MFCGRGYEIVWVKGVLDISKIGGLYIANKILYEYFCGILPMIGEYNQSLDSSTIASRLIEQNEFIRQFLFKILVFLQLRVPGSVIGHYCAFVMNSIFDLSCFCFCVYDWGRQSIA